MIALPPYAKLIGATLQPDDEDAGSLLLLPYGDRVEGRLGFFHGGALAGLLEMAAFVALLEALALRDQAPPRIKPINITVDYMRAGRPLDTFAKGHVTRLGNRIANVTADAWQKNRDAPIASARLNLLLDR